jgi:chemotaxis methyl-accepting protein methylase
MPPLEAEVWRDFIRQRSGLDYTPNRLHFMQQRLWERMCRRRATSYSEYYHHVAYSSEGEVEWQELLETLVNRETGFFRHQPSYDALMGTVLPRLMAEPERQLTRRLALWSAGCSTGQEAYSLAMAFLEVAQASNRPPAWPAGATQPADTADWQVLVYGSDISPRALERARRGRYRDYEVRFMPEQYRRRYLAAEDDGRRGTAYRVIDPVAQRVSFGHTNLAAPDSYPAAAQDVIFCQNVLIYFQPADRIEVVRRLVGRLCPGGYLFLAPAEVVGLRLPGVQPVRLADVLLYQRQPEAGAR